jgi:hypothetical protein
MSPTGPIPQFGTAEYASTGETCKSCKQPISGNYYRINGLLACENCVRQVQQQMPKDSHAAYVRAVVFGIGAAVLGLVAYAGLSILLQGWQIGYMSLGVGWLVGKAMRVGSSGIGGRRYQIAAAALTYAAVSIAAVPIALYFHSERSANHQVQHPAPRTSSPQPNSGPNSAPDSQTQAPSDLVDNPPPSEPIKAPRPKKSLPGILGALLLLGLASPFLELTSPLSGIIGLVILAVGINIAWKMTAGPKLEIIGPFQDRGGSALPSAAG